MGEPVYRRAIVRGSVQGVGFRYSAAVMAERLGVGGSVENLPDGTVRADVVGDAAAVDDFVTWLRSGPPSATVTGVDVIDLDAAGQGGPGRRVSARDGFSIR